MELSDYLKVLRRRWISIVVIGLVCMFAAFALTLTQTKMYSSSARLFVSTTTDDANSLNQGGQFSIARVQSYADLVSSQELATSVINDLGLEMGPDELSESVSAKVATNTVNLTLTVTNPDPHLAQQIAQSYAENLSDMVRQLETPPGRKRLRSRSRSSTKRASPTSPSRRNLRGTPYSVLWRASSWALVWPCCARRSTRESAP